MAPRLPRRRIWRRRPFFVWETLGRIRSRSTRWPNAPSRGLDRKRSGARPPADLCKLLADAARRGEIVFRFDRPHIVSVVNERPEASAVARVQSEAGEPMTNLLHSSVLVGNAMSRQLLASIDGTRTIGELQAEVNRLNSISAEGRPEAPDVNNLLLKLAKSALLVR